MTSRPLAQSSITCVCLCVCSVCSVGRVFNFQGKEKKEGPQNASGLTAIRCDWSVRRKEGIREWANIIRELQYAWLCAHITHAFTSQPGNKLRKKNPSVRWWAMRERAREREQVRHLSIHCTCVTCTAVREEEGGGPEGERGGSSSFHTHTHTHIHTRSVLWPLVRCGCSAFSHSALGFGAKRMPAPSSLHFSLSEVFIFKGKTTSSLNSQYKYQLLLLLLL